MTLEVRKSNIVAQNLYKKNMDLSIMELDLNIILTIMKMQ